MLEFGSSHNGGQRRRSRAGIHLNAMAGQTVGAALLTSRQVSRQSSPV